jgi:hypothetical protein
MSIVIPEHLLAFEAAADKKIAFANANPSVPAFEVGLITISIALRRLESDRQQDFNGQYLNEITVVLLKKGYTYKSIIACSDFIRYNTKPADFFELDADGQDTWRDAEFKQAIALLKKADAPIPAKIKVGDTATYTTSDRTEKGVIKNILLRKEARGKDGVDVSEIDSKDVALCIFDIGAHWCYGSYITAIEPQKPYIADVPTAKISKPFLGSFIALFAAFSLSIASCYIQPTLATRQPQGDKHEQHFEVLQSRLKHGHSEALYFIRNYSRTAEHLGKCYDISPEIILAVGILESGGGTSNIALNSRNFHGIKAGDHWDGLTFTCANGKVWRAWNNSAEAFEGFCQYVCERMPHFVGKNITPAEFAAAYGSAHPKAYAEKLHTIIARYGLKTLFQYEQ